MKTKTIKIDNKGYILVDLDATIQEGDWYVYPTIKPKGSSIDRYVDIAGIEHEISLGNLKAIKIIASSFPLEGIPTFETLPPNTEDDVEKLAKEKYEYVSQNLPHTIITPKDKIEGFIDGYKQAKSETMFSLDNMKLAILSGYNLRKRGGSEMDRKELEKTLIQSLTKQPEYEFVIEEVFDYKDKTSNSGYGYGFGKQPKIVNNKIQGVWKQIK